MSWQGVRRLLAAPVVAASALLVRKSENDSPNLNNEVISIISNKLHQKMVQGNIPGTCCVVHVDGKPVFRSGFGFSDIENCTPFTPKTSIRIASISKTITALISLNLVQQQKLNLDENLTNLLKSNNISLKYQNREIDHVTLRQLLSHTAGIRHYHGTSKLKEGGVGYAEEFYSSKHCSSVEDSLQLFIEDDLLFIPGTDYTYTTSGYSLVSYILEKVTETKFRDLVSDFTGKMGLSDTRFDSFQDLIPNRSRYYCTDPDGHLVNCAYVDNSCKWAGGGLVGTADDLAKLGDVILYLYQSRASDNYIDKQHFDEMIKLDGLTEKPVQGTGGLGSSHYGSGIRVVHETTYAGQPLQYFSLSHTGGAVGACCLVLALPLGEELREGHVSGVTVVLCCNHINGGQIVKLGDEVARIVAGAIEGHS